MPEKIFILYLVESREGAVSLSNLWPASDPLKKEFALIIFPNTKAIFFDSILEGKLFFEDSLPARGKRMVAFGWGGRNFFLRIVSVFLKMRLGGRFFLLIEGWRILAKFLFLKSFGRLRTVNRFVPACCLRREFAG